MPDDSQNEVPLILPSFSDLSKYELDASRLQLDRQKQQIETLKLLYTGAMDRWKDRRANEWKLNYAIWAGLAAFDGVLLANKVVIKLPHVPTVAIVLVGLAFHTAYLYPTIERAIAEIDLLNDLEKAIRKLIQDADIKKMVKLKHLGGAVNRFEDWGKPPDWLWRHYGLFAPLAFTAALLGVAGILISKQ